MKYPTSTHRFTFLPLALYMLGLNIDSITTYFVIHATNLIELNPVVQFAYGSAGLAGIFGWKLAITGAALILLSQVEEIDEDEHHTQKVLLAGCGCIWSVAGLWNLFILSP